MGIARIVCLAAVLALAVLPGSASAFFTQLEQKARATAETSENKQITVSCPSGKRVVGAGADVTPGNGHVLIDAIRPNASLTRVTARAKEDETGTGADWFVAAYAVCAAPPAGLERVVATTASSSANKSAAAACPGAKRLLGTGGEIASPNGQVLLDGLLPDPALTQAMVNALEDETGNSQSWTVTAYAICSDPVAGLELVPATGTASSASSRVTSAVCPPGKSLLSASGTINSPNGQVVLDAMFPDAALTTAGFAAFEDDTGNTESWNLTAYAICAASARREGLEDPRTYTQRIGRGNRCSAGRRPTGVGAEILGGLGQVWLRGIEPEFRDYGSSSSPDETGVASPFGIVLHGICTTTISADSVASASTPSNSASPKSVVVACPPGLRVLGAGGAVLTVVGGVLTNGPDFVLEAIRPDPTLTFVTAVGREDRTGTDAAWSVTVNAVCGPPPPGLQLVTRTGAAGSQEFAVATAVCPAGKHLLGAGAEIVDGLGRVGFDDVRPDERLTRTTVVATEDEVGFEADWRPVAHSICVNR